MGRQKYYSLQKQQLKVFGKSIIILVVVYVINAILLTAS